MYENRGGLQNWSYVFLSTLFYSALAVSAKPVVTCEALGTPLLELETHKSSLASGDYDDFLKFAGRNTSSSEELQSYVNTLERAFPDGFNSCSTVFSEALSDRMLQELVLLETHDSRPFMLYWTVANFRGEWEVLEYRVTSEFSEISEVWK